MINKKTKKLIAALSNSSMSIQKAVGRNHYILPNWKYAKKPDYTEIYNEIDDFMINNIPPGYSLKLVIEESTNLTLITRIVHWCMHNDTLLEIEVIN